MTFEQSTGGTIYEKFIRFHTRNPHVFEEIVRRAKLLIEQGKKHFSVKTIVGEIRNDERQKTDTTAESAPRYKINDAYISRYARLLIETYPEMKPFVELRTLRS